ncbi:MAG: bifunctional 4-hydroxy-3-methylbut-2-enyl diphosphate reductase/30S ribosomal protein S1 [Acutalibacteraceae bacterium]|nr:bifunctional 4-hydroxy-3-methylbut-2-enyl diphosphate reductase/30S ribosomal protein S1 [Acutalibacteraceae bacterium]
MHEIIVAKTAGFCFGVNRAIKLTEELADAGKRVCTLGPIIHNNQMVAMLEEKGVRTAENENDRKENEIMVIRSHGVTPDILAVAEKKGEVVDATCPYVSNIHKIVQKAYEEQSEIIIVGDKNHPEVIGISGWCNNKCYIVSGDEELKKLLEQVEYFSKKNITVVAQTTFNAEEWRKCQKTFKKVCTNSIIFDTICKATSLRQQEASELAKKCDAMIVIGGKHSSNTLKLAEVCSASCEKVYHIETATELPINELKDVVKIGVTAGASTPSAIIKEVLIIMSEMQNPIEVTTEMEEKVVEKSIDDMTFEEALEASLNSMNSEQKVHGVVLSVNRAEIQVDIGRKQTGYVSAEEYSSNPNVDLVSEVKVGDELDLIILRTNDMEGTIMLSKRRFDAIAGWNKINEAKETNEILEGVVTEVIKGGVIVVCNGVRVFIPASQATVSRNESLENLKDNTVNFRIIEIGRGRRAVGSIRSVLREARKEIEEKFWAEIEVGKRYTGVVKTLTNYGAFVDLGGVDGMVHISELSWSRIKHPSEVVNVGDTVDVYVKDLDTEKKKISLGFKNAEDNPWEILKNNYEVGSVVKATVVSMTTYGAFARIIPGIDGLIHISQIANERIEKIADVLSVGQEVEAQITAIDFDKKRVSLSMKALLEPVAAEEVAEEVVATTDAE